MVAPVESAEDRRSASSFIGSFPDGPDQMVIVVRGDLVAEVLGRLGVHLDVALAARTRFLIIDASAVTRCEPALLDLLGRTQRRLDRHQGMLTVRGLRPSLLSEVAGTVRSPSGRAADDPRAPDGASSGAWPSARRAS